MNRRLILVVLAAVAAAEAPSYAQLGSRPAEDWIARLERPERVAALKTAEVTQKIGLKKGDVVADLGAGAGAFAWVFARAVAPATVYAVEVDPGYIPYLQRRAQEQELSNVKTVLGAFDDPRLPEKVDVAFFHDVLHHVEKRAEYLKTVAGYLKPKGRIAVIELDSEKPGSSHANEPALQVTRQQVQTWMEAAGLSKLEEIPLFDDKWFVIYGLK